MKHTVGITIVGRDREGAVSAFTGYVFRQGGNIEKINQNVIKGLFGMYMEASFPDGTDVSEIGAGLEEVASGQEMEASVYNDAKPTRNIAVFVTREPGCLEEIIRSRDTLTGKVSVVVGTQDTLEPLAADAGIPFVLVDERDQAAAEEEIIKVCRSHDIDVIVLARYMRILTPNFVWRYPNRIINIHPSLLPAFPGALAYAQAHERGTKIAGVTAHYVTENLDQGPIIAQDSFQVDPEMTLEQVREEGQRLEARVLLESLRLHLRGRLEVRWRKVHVRQA